MGCGSSSLKGDQVGDVGGSDMPGIKKTATNFSQVDYDQSSKGRRDTLYAPHESKARPSTVPEEEKSRAGSSGSAGHASQPKRSTEASNARAEMMGMDTAPEGDKLKPYKSIAGDEDGLASPTDLKSANIDPIAAAKKESSLEHQPANAQVSDNSAPSVFSDNASTLVPSKEQSHSNTKVDSSEDGRPRKKSMYEKYMDKRLNRPPPGQSKFSDEELKKFTGKTNAEMKEWSNDPKSQVAGHYKVDRHGWEAVGSFGATTGGP